MKIRTGFVSNSSSASFIIGFKGDLKEQLEKYFAMPEKHPLRNFVSVMVDKLSNAEIFTDVKKYWQNEESFSELPDDEAAIFKKYGKLAKVEVESGEPVNDYLRDHGEELQVDSEQLTIIYHDY